jgi:Galactose oxidase, central domain
MDGSNTANAKGFTATPPVSPVTALDTASPGGRKYPATWVDNSGNLWMFGGIGFDIPTTTNPIFLNDMWQYSGTQRYYGGYDSGASTYWVQNQANNWFSSTAPGPRWGAVSWKDNTGKLLLFGGQAGTLGAGGIGFLNDMWQFDTSGIGAWTRLSFTNPLCNNSAFNNNGIYGTQGTPSANNCPGSRWGAAYSTDASGNLWVFGGFGFDAASSTPGLLNDLWEYTTAGQWVWVSGANTINPDGVYGTQGTAASSNVPGGRQAASSWLDASGTVWLFGGYNLSQGGQPNGFNDLWKYSSGQWTWVSGANTVNQTGIYGVQGTPAAANAPGARWGAASWIDPAGRLWLFGGEGYDTTANGGLADLWQFSAGQWTWVKGPNSVSQVGAYGLTPAQQDFPHVVNYPGSRFFPAYWNDRANGYFWMLGGEGFDSTTTSGGIGLMNDLWRYLPFP